MTIEDKAKLYDEALKKAKDVIEQNPLMEYLKKGIEYILPELKESEDERMIKSMTRLVKAFYDCNFPTPEGFERKDMLTWLEKQGEQDPYNGVSFKYNGHTWGMCARDNGVDILLDRQLIKHLEKQGKQEEPQVYKTKDGEIIAYSETDGYKVEQKTQGKSALEAIKEEKVDNANKVEQKSVEWSEEDENLTELKDRFDEEYGKVGDCISWLKSLKDRVLPQPKQEWSEEDEQITLSIEQVMNCASLLNIFPEKLNKINKWLKSLKQRYTWKPSDEQIEALEHFVRSVGESGYASPYDNNTKLLYSILSDLKKLKED